MFLIARIDEDGKTNYWTGGEIWSVQPEEAARFYGPTEADATIDILKTVFAITKHIQAVPLPEGVD
jgi:hypothetical protein